MKRVWYVMILTWHQKETITPYAIKDSSRLEIAYSQKVNCTLLVMNLDSVVSKSNTKKTRPWLLLLLLLINEITKNIISFKLPLYLIWNVLCQIKDYIEKKSLSAPDAAVTELIERLQGGVSAEVQKFTSLSLPHLLFTSTGDGWV